MHVLLLVIDCLRMDHTSLAGYDRETTPFLQELARKSAVFKGALSPSSWTYPSVISMLTGLYPREHGGMYMEEPRNFDRGELPAEPRDDIEWLPEVLESKGYETFAMTTLPFAEMALEGHVMKLVSRDKAPAREVFDRYVDWICKRDGGANTFAYLHLCDLHEPVVVDYPYYTLFGRIEKLPGISQWGDFRNAVEEDPEFQKFRESRIRLYDAALAQVDDEIRFFLHRLRRAGLTREMLLIVTADHGEELWDHLGLERKFYDPRNFYGISHGHHHWQELVHVPLLIWGSGVHPATYPKWRSTAAIAETIVEILGVDGMKSTSLNLFWEAPKRVHVESTAYGYEKRAIISGDTKYYSSKGDGISWVFDLKEDPGEIRPRNWSW